METTYEEQVRSMERLAKPYSRITKSVFYLWKDEIMECNDFECIVINGNNKIVFYGNLPLQVGEMILTSQIKDNSDEYMMEIHIPEEVFGGTCEDMAIRISDDPHDMRFITRLWNDDIWDVVVRNGEARDIFEEIKTCHFHYGKLP